MGDAKRKLAAMRQRHIELARWWDFPPSPEEASICDALREMEIINVRRASSAELSYMRMATNSCHANARWYEKNDPLKQSVAVTGWWVQWPDFVLHSVVKIRGVYICITPSDSREGAIPFIPDPNIRWIERGDQLVPFKDGYEIGMGVRLFPEFSMAKMNIVKEKIVSGVNPLEAMFFSDIEIKELHSKYVDKEIAKKWNPDYFRQFEK